MDWWIDALMDRWIDWKMRKWIRGWMETWIDGDMDRWTSNVKQKTVWVLMLGLWTPNFEFHRWLLMWLVVFLKLAKVCKMLFSSINVSELMGDAKKGEVIKRRIGEAWCCSSQMCIQCKPCYQRRYAHAVYTKPWMSTWPSSQAHTLPLSLPPSLDNGSGTVLPSPYRGEMVVVQIRAKVYFHHPIKTNAMKTKTHNKETTGNTYWSGSS